MKRRGRLLSWLVTAVVLCLILLFSSSCSSSGKGPGERPFGAKYPRSRTPRYFWGFANSSEIEVKGVGFTWPNPDGPFVASGGANLRPIPGSYGPTDDSGWDPIPDTGFMHWTTPDGVRHKQEMVIASRIPEIKEFAGTIWLQYTPDGKWEVIPITNAEKLRRLKAG